MEHTMTNEGFQKLIDTDSIEGWRDRGNSDYFN